MTRNFKSRVSKSVVGALGLVILMSCSSKLQVEDKSPLSANVVRLGDTAIAEVDGTNIYLSDIEHSALSKGLIATGDALTPDNPVFQSELDELIDQRLLALEALRLSLDQNDETRRRLAASRERILGNIVVEALLAEKINDETVQRMFDEQAALRDNNKQIRTRQIVVKTQEKAQELKELVAKGGDMADLAKEFSQDPSTRDLGGDMGYFSKDSVSKIIADQAFSLKKGDVSAPFKTKLGWHIVKMESERATPQPKFEDIKPEIVSFMTYDEIEKKLKLLRNASTIELKLGQQKGPDHAP